MSPKLTAKRTKCLSKSSFHHDIAIMFTLVEEQKEVYEDKIDKVKKQYMDIRF